MEAESEIKTEKQMWDSSDGESAVRKDNGSEMVL